jgi:Cytochrome c oxidase assembly protein CtaG/Cox11.
MTALNEATPMVFRSEIKKLKVHPGEYYTVNFYAENKTDKVMIARAIPSISPGAVAEFFKKQSVFVFQNRHSKREKAGLCRCVLLLTLNYPRNIKRLHLHIHFLIILKHQ